MWPDPNCYLIIIKAAGQLQISILRRLANIMSALNITAVHHKVETGFIMRTDIPILAVSVSFSAVQHE